MKTYIWTYAVMVGAEDEIEAQERIEEMIEDAINDPDGIYSYGKLEVED